jgi:hypothetical protein
MTHAIHPDYGRCMITNTTPCKRLVTVKIIKTGYVTSILRKHLSDIPKTDITDMH